SARCGTAYHYSLLDRPLARGTRPVFWSLGKTVGGATVGFPAGASIDSGSGRISWTPGGAPRLEHLTLVAANSAGKDAQDFDVAIDCPMAKKELRGPLGISCGCSSGVGLGPVV